MIQLIKNRSDIGAGTRGSDMGIDALEIAAINQGDDYFNRFPSEDIQTHNETIYQKNTNSKAKRIEHVSQQCQRVCDSVYKHLTDKKFPIVLSGDHSSALGTISGIKKALPHDILGVIWIDAHADMHSPYTSPSGNLHGMPLAAALGIDHITKKKNELSEEVIQYWDLLKNIGTPGIKLLPEHLVYFGLRDYESAEASIIKELSIPVFAVEDIRSQTIEKCMKQVIAALEKCTLIYISFDVDSLDCEQISNGTGTPVKSGFLPNEIIQIFEYLFNTKKVVGIEIAEINPLLDNKGNKMAETAFSILAKISQAIEI